MNLNWTPSNIHKIHSLLPFGLYPKPMQKSIAKVLEDHKYLHNDTCIHFHYMHTIDNSLHVFRSFPLKDPKKILPMGGHGSSFELRRDGPIGVQSHGGSRAVEQFRGRSSFGGANWGGWAEEVRKFRWEKNMKLLKFRGGLCLGLKGGVPENTFGRSELWI